MNEAFLPRSAARAYEQFEVLLIHFDRISYPAVVSCEFIQGVGGVLHQGGFFSFLKNSRPSPHASRNNSVAQATPQQQPQQQHIQQPLTQRADNANPAERCTRECRHRGETYPLLVASSHLMSLQLTVDCRSFPFSLWHFYLR